MKSSNTPHHTTTHMNTTQTAVATVKVLGTMVMRREASITRFLEDMVSELHEFGFDILRYSLAAVWFIVKAEWYSYKTEFQTIAQPEVHTFEEPTTEVYELDPTPQQRDDMQPTVAALATPATNERVEKAPYIRVLDRTYSMMTIAGCKAALDNMLD